MNMLVLASLAFVTLMQDDSTEVLRHVSVDDQGEISVKNKSPSGVEVTRSRSEKEWKRMIGSPPPPLEGGEWFNVDAPLTWDDLRGKVVLLDFWGIYCGPCVATVPKLKRLYKKHRVDGLIVLGVHTNSYGTAEDVREFIEDRKITYPVLMATDETFEAFGQWGLPTYFLVDREGKIDLGFSNQVPWGRQIKRLLTETDTKK
jgi:thiol-disulfide isomerase/thioredoxin